MVQWEGRVLIDTLQKKVKGKGNMKVMEEVIEEYLPEVKVG